MYYLRCTLGLCLTLLAAIPCAGQPWTVFDYAARLGAGVNLGNALEAPREGEWGLRLEEWNFAEIAAGGFDHVRVPIRWNAHASPIAPYAITPAFFDRIDWVVDQALRYDLAVILDFHHYDELHADPEQHQQRFVGIWQQVATRYRDAPDTVYFELLNEPHDQLTSVRWNSLLLDGIAAIRATNPDRPIIVGPADWNAVGALNQLRLPADDRNLIATYHYYDPFAFTHQGAEWVEGSEAWLGQTWAGSGAELRAVERDFSIARNFSERTGRPVYVGEYGAYSTADMESRAAWTQHVSALADELGFSRAYWEFAAGFGVYDGSQRAWVEPLYDALDVRSRFDVNNDRTVSRDDFERLTAIVTSGTDVRGDLNRDGLVSQLDLSFWSHFAGPRTGDIDRDGQWTVADIDRLTGVTPQTEYVLQYDLDNNGRVDAGDRNYLVLHLLDSHFGDANLDGAFDSSDLVRVFAGGKYERPEAAGWSEGDWDGNGLFESSDLILALAQGIYEREPSRGESVPEATPTLPMFCCLIHFVRSRRRR